MLMAVKPRSHVPQCEFFIRRSRKTTWSCRGGKSFNGTLIHRLISPQIFISIFNRIFNIFMNRITLILQIYFAVELIEFN